MAICTSSRNSDAALISCWVGGELGRRRAGTHRKGDSRDEEACKPVVALDVHDDCGAQHGAHIDGEVKPAQEGDAICRKRTSTPPWQLPIRRTSSALQAHASGCGGPQDCRQHRRRRRLTS
jgi:hypothetical protein